MCIVWHPYRNRRCCCTAVGGGTMTKTACLLWHTCSFEVVVVDKKRIKMSFSPCTTPLLFMLHLFFSAAAPYLKQLDPVYIFLLLILYFPLSKNLLHTLIHMPPDDTLWSPVPQPPVFTYDLVQYQYHISLSTLHILVGASYLRNTSAFFLFQQQTFMS